MESVKAIGIPMSLSYKLDNDENGKSINQKFYIDIIESLLYLTISRPNIIFSIRIYARFQSNPKESHMLSDADYGGCKIDKKKHK